MYYPHSTDFFEGKPIKLFQQIQLTELQLLKFNHEPFPKTMIRSVTEIYDCFHHSGFGLKPLLKMGNHFGKMHIMCNK
jgi:hypothetical protein